MNTGELLTAAKQAERRYVLARPLPADSRRLPWMPSDIAQWLVLLVEAMEAQHGIRYLEIGCGPGAKLLLARELFGLAAYGFDTDKKAVELACQMAGRCAWVADAATFTGYGNYDIVFFNRPFRDAAAEADLERTVWGGMRPGAAVICMNLEHPPPRWVPVADDWEARRGVWLKPLPHLL